MKKKIKDLTVEEIKQICNKNNCLLDDSHCPLAKICIVFDSITKKDMEQEVEVEEDE